MNANLRNCPQCGRLFAYSGRNLCQRCIRAEEDEYMVVRRYVRDHPGASIFEVSDETGIEEDKILQFLRDGRLEARGLRQLLECERCGKKISAGTYCEDCLKAMDAELRSVVKGGKKREPEPEEPASRTREKMYIRSKNKPQP